MKYSEKRKEYMRNIYSKNWTRSRKECGGKEYYKIYGVNWDHSFTLEEINTTTDFDQFDRLVYIIIKNRNKSLEYTNQTNLSCHND